MQVALTVTPDQQYNQQLATCWKFRFSGTTLDMLSQNSGSGALQGVLMGAPAF